MKMRNLKHVAAIALAVGLLAGLPSVASALTFGDANDLGQVLFGIPSGDADRTSYVNHLIGMTPGTSDSFSGQTFNRTLASCGTCPTAILSFSGSSTTIDLGTGGYTYLFAKYDGPNAGSEVWNVQGLTGIITIPATGLAAQNDAGHGYGLSGWTLFGGANQVPDGGSTVALLGVALGGLEAVRRMLRARKA
jgi:hypothetical protein